MVDKIDKNKDGNISENELTEWIKYISMYEATDFTKKRLEKSYSKVMKDDGLISWEEFFSIRFEGSIEGMYCTVYIIKIVYQFNFRKIPLGRKTEMKKTYFGKYF